MAEQDPLLGLHDENPDSGASSAYFELKSKRRYYLCVFTLKFVIQFVAALLELPLVQLLEVKVCREHNGYLNQAPQKSNCKVPNVQNKVALLLGLKVTFDAIPGATAPAKTIRLSINTSELLTSLWYGTIANRLGRRSVLALASFGGLLAWSWVCLVCEFSSSAKPDYSKP